MAGDFVTQAELEAALEALREPGRFDAAERLVAQAAPGLQRILAEALAGGGWNSEDDAREIEKALVASDHATALTALRTHLAEQTRLAMLVGVAVGIELANELDLGGADDEPSLTITRHSSSESGQ
ncbi:MAG: hypothetical protein AAGC46_20735 [Solirubrobacteraceae bacterium]|nr:hypothetical protein [Patulibacter sp.]